MTMDVAPEDRRKFIRFDDAKGNYHKLEKVRWFEKRTALVGNATGFLPEDEVGVLVPWVPPGALDGLSIHELNDVLDTIDRGLVDESGKATGQRYSPSSTGANADRWAGRVLTRMLECSDDAAKNILKKWLKGDVLEVFDYTDPVVRKPRKGVRSVLANRPGKETYRGEI